MSKKLVKVALAIVVIAVVAVVGIFVLPSLAPPVDISGVNPPATMTTEELLPAELAGIQLVAESVQTDVSKVEVVRPGTSRSFFVESTTALYDGIAVKIIKAKDESSALWTLDVIYEEEYWYRLGYQFDKMHVTIVGDWFECDVDGSFAFFWRSGVWVFGIEAGNSDARQQAAEEFVQHLRSLSL